MSEKVESGKRISEIFSMSKPINIPNYQRGYRWSSIHVIQLLEDILSDFENKKSYCLQTLIVREYEKQINVIDGQQRLTTIIIIVGAIVYISGQNYLNIPQSFTLKYETRKKSEDFLKHLMTLSINNEELNWISIWNSFCSKHSYSIDSENIDFRYMADAFISTVDELRVIGKIESGLYNNLCKYILDNCFFIWYPVSSSDNEEEQFYRVNMGKIFLTNSDLIKSDFMKPSDTEDNGYFQRVALLAEKWYQIEKELRNPELWAFIPHNNQYGIWNNENKCYEERNIYFSRIDEIFQLYLIKLCECNNRDYKQEMINKGSDRFFLYHSFKQWLTTEFFSKKRNINDAWNAIEQMYYDIVELYDADGRETLYRSHLRQTGKNKKLTNLKEDSLYNLIAYIIYSYSVTLEKSEFETGRVLLALVDANRMERRSLILKSIKVIIMEILNTEENTDMDTFGEKIRTLSYEEDRKGINDFHDERKDKNKKIKNILMLFNLILLDRNTGLSNRYDFLNNRYWGLEHIFSQNEKIVVGEGNKIYKTNEKIEKLKIELQNLKELRNHKDIFEIDDFHNYDDIKKKVVNWRKNLEKAPEEKKIKLQQNVTNDFYKLIKSKEEDISQELNKERSNTNKMISNEDAFIIRKIIIENLYEYIDSEKTNKNGSFDHDKIKLLYKLIGFIEELYKPYSDIIWEEVIDRDFIETKKDEIIFEMLKKREYDIDRYDSLISKLFELENNQDNTTQGDVIVDIQSMLGLDELRLYFDYIISVKNDYATLVERHEGDYESIANNHEGFKSCIEKAAICKFVESKKESNVKILRKVYEKEVDDYFKNHHAANLMDNSLCNLALLKSKENRYIANSFIEKKQKVNELISKGTSIPYSTLLVFTDRYYRLTKIYNGERLQWLPSSRDMYFDDIVENIYKFCFVEKGGYGDI